VESTEQGRISHRPGAHGAERVAAETLPELLRQVRRKRSHQPGQIATDRLPGLVARAASLDVVLHQVGKLHQRGHGGVEAEGVDVAGDLVDRLVEFSSQYLLGNALPDGRGALVLLPDHEPPDPVQEAGDAIDAPIVPFRIELRRADEELIDPARVGAVLLDHVVGGDPVALRLGHHGAVAVDHALGEEGLEGLVDGNHAGIEQDLHEKSRVQQMQDGVLDPPGVLVHRHPVVGLRLVERLRRLTRAGVAQEVPGGVDERIHGVGLPPRRLAANRANRVDEALGVQQGVLPVGPELDLLRQAHR